MTLAPRRIPQRKSVGRTRRPTLRSGLRQCNRESVFVGLLMVCIIDFRWGSALILATSLWAGVQWGRRRRGARQRIFAMHRDLPDIVQLLRVSVAAGNGPRQALVTVGHVVHELADCDSEPSEVRNRFVVVGRSLEAGRSLREALDMVAQGSALLERLSLLMTSAEQDGQHLARGLERLVDGLNNARLLQLDARAQRATVSLLFPLVLCILPSFLLLVVVPVLIASFDEIGTGLLSR